MIALTSLPDWIVRQLLLKEPRWAGVAGSCLLLAAYLTPMAHAQDLTAWQKDREAKFAAFKAAHP